jgi:TM2 domain-containing membrane protein YozV
MRSLSDGAQASGRLPLLYRAREFRQSGRKHLAWAHQSTDLPSTTTRKGSTTLNTVTVSTRSVNKVAFVLLSFFLGAFGVDRFMRGQVGLGIFKLLIGSWATLGIWPLVDFIIALVKLGKYQDDFIFDNAGAWVEPAAR